MADDFGIDLDLDFDFDLIDEDEQENELTVPKVARPKTVKYDNAVQFAQEMTVDTDMRYYAMVSGNFIFGDFIEALIAHHRIPATEMYICTLGMSENNVDSIKNLLVMGVKKINLIASHYFYSVERHNLVPYMIEEYAGYPITLAVAGSHMKVCLIHTDKLDIVIRGSANLSSSNSIEQLDISNDKTLYEFNKIILDAIVERYTVYNGDTMAATPEKDKANCGNKLWEVVGNGRFKPEKLVEKEKPKREKKGSNGESGEKGGAESKKRG